MPSRTIRRLALAVLVMGAGCSEAATDPPVAEDQRSARAPDPQATKVALDEAAALERAGDLEGALAAAKTAIESGGGRDATVTAAKLCIALSRFDEAIGLLEPLVAAHADDAIAQYDLGLAHHQRNDYNGARRGYLAALRLDPGMADARFNLALLCWKRGIQGEGKHHVEKFLEAFPDDPRGASLKAMMAESGGAASPGLAEPADPPGAPAG